jgi:opacity protein-like surface antigen
MLILGAILILALPVLAQDQDYPKAEVYGGYLLIHEEGTTTNGFLASVEGNINRSVGIVGEFGFGAQTNKEDFGVSIKLREYNFLGGPRVSYRADKFRIFAHALFGGIKVTGDAEDVHVSTTDFAMAFGGGVDINAGKHVAIRLAQVDLLVGRWHFGEIDQSGWSNQLRYSGGIVFKFGQ